MFNIASCNFLQVITDSEHGKYLNFFLNRPQMGSRLREQNLADSLNNAIKKSRKGGQLSFQAPWPGISSKLKQVQVGTHEMGH